MNLCLASSNGFKTGACRTLSRSTGSWSRVAADLVRRTGLAREETSITSPHHLFVLNLRGSSDEGQYFLDGKPTGFVRRRPGSILFMPAGCKWMGWEAGASSAAYLAIRVEPDLVTELLGTHERRPRVSLRAELGCEDPVLTNAARGIAAEIQDQSLLGALLVESYVDIMFAQLLRLQRCAPATPKAGGLPTAKLSRVMARIEEDLDANLSLSTLSALAGLSIPHFCRAFRESVGVAPYRFVVNSRIARAKEFLRHSEMSVTEISLSCGFSSSSHFANLFRREVGMTPAAFRAL